MSQTKNDNTNGMEQITELLEESETPLAVMSEGIGAYHLVDTTTFDNSASAPSGYEGHAASIGGAEALCGHEPFARMLPEDVAHKDRICGNCLRSLRADAE